MSQARHEIHSITTKRPTTAVVKHKNKKQKHQIKKKKIKENNEIQPK